MQHLWRDVSMCIVCAGSRWSRRLAGAAPWLVVPILVLWGVTQFFPKGWRIEVTSPRVLCVITLLSLAWYELALPRLKDFRARRKAEALERKRILALEEARWRKVATRRCRNCLAAYEKQTPPGGKFMCTYCGHVSRKPVLDAPNGAAPGTGGSAGRGPGWLLDWCGALKEALCLERCEKGQKAGWLGTGLWLTSWGVSLGLWPLRRGWRACRALQGLREDEKGDEERRGERRGDEGAVSKEEKARKRAEEKAQARLEREALEAEEQKQRLEVARLVEERRRERDRQLAAQREGEKEAEKERERERRREQETARRRPDKQRDRQKAPEKENEKKPARSSSGEVDKPARGNQPGPLRDTKEKVGSDREVKPVSRPLNGTTTQNHTRSPPVHLKSDLDAKTRAGIVKNGPVINVRTVQAKVAAAVAAAKTNQSAPGVRPPAVGPSTTNAWANGPLPAVRKAATSQKPATPPPIMPPGSGVGSAAGAGGAGENGPGGASSAWFGSAWATPWAKVAAAGAEAAGPGPSSAPKSPSAPQPGRSWHSLFTRHSPSQHDPPPPLHLQSNPPSPYASSPLGSPFGRSPASPPLPEDSTFEPPYGTNGLAYGHAKGVWGNSTSSLGQFTQTERGQFAQSERGQFTSSEMSAPHRPAPVGTKVRNGTADPIQRLVDDPWGTGVNSRFQDGMNGHGNSHSANGRYQSDGVNGRFPGWDESGSSSGSSGKWRMWDTPALEEISHTSAQLSQPSRGGPPGMPSRPLSADSVASSASSWSYRPGSARSQATPPPESDAALKLAQHLEMLSRSPGVSPSPPPIKMTPSSSISLPTSLSPRSPQTGSPSLNLPKTLSPLASSLSPQSLSPTRSLPTSFAALPETLNPEPAVPETLQMYQALSPTLLKPAKVLSALPASAASAPPFIPESMSNSSTELAEALARAHAALPSGAPWGDHVARLETARSIWEEADRAHIMVPPEFVDCITQEVMVDPVITADGHSYERSAIEVWLRHHDTSPMTGEVLPPPPGQDNTGVDKTLRPNHILRGQIIEYRERLTRGAKQRVAEQAGWGSTSGQPSGQATERPRLALFLHNDQGVW